MNTYPPRGGRGTSGPWMQNMQVVNQRAKVQGHGTHSQSEAKPSQDHKIERIDCTTIRLDSRSWKKCKRALYNHASVGAHPHLARMLEIDYSAPYITVKTEHAKQTLRDLLLRMGPLPEVVSQWLLLQLLHAVDYCHGSGICSCDIRPTNIYVTYSAARKPIIKLANFACSRQYEAGQSLELTSPFNHKNSIGEIAFMAPEILQQLVDNAGRAAGAPAAGEGEGGEAAGGRGVHYDGAGVDVWCMGVVLYFMLFNRMPFTDGQGQRRSLIEQVKYVIARSKDGNWAIPSKPEVGPQCVDVLKRMLAPRESRITIKELWEHPWILERMPPTARTFNDDLRKQQLEKGLTARLTEVLQHCETAIAAAGMGKQLD